MSQSISSEFVQTTKVSKPLERFSEVELEMDPSQKLFEPQSDSVPNSEKRTVFIVKGTIKRFQQIRAAQHIKSQSIIPIYQISICAS